MVLLLVHSASICVNGAALRLFRPWLRADHLPALAAQVVAAVVAYASTNLSEQGNEHEQKRRRKRWRVRRVRSGILLNVLFALQEYISQRGPGLLALTGV